MNTVRIYESGTGQIFAAVYRNGRLQNLIRNLEESRLSGWDFISAAKTGFQYADSFDPEEWDGLTLQQALENLDDTAEEIALISPSDCIIYHNFMGLAGKAIFPEVVA